MSERVWRRHFAFFGAFGMLVLAAIYTIVPAMRRISRLNERPGLWAFWLMTVGMLAMVGAFTIAGIVQTYLTRVLGLDFMLVRAQYVRFWIFWVWAAGLVLFLPGVLIYVRDFFGLRPAPAAGAEG
jgi:nitric oxide reductase subunit B